MAVLLLVERQRGQASPVWGYIQQLPESIDTPVRWADADLAQLQYPPLIEDVSVLHVVLLCCWVLRACGTQIIVWDLLEGRSTVPKGALWCKVKWTEGPHQCSAALYGPCCCSRPCTLQVRQQQRQWRGHYEGLRAALRQGAPAVGWDDFLWAAENVRSRAFSGPYTGTSLCRRCWLYPTCHLGWLRSLSAYVLGC